VDPTPERIDGTPSHEFEQDCADAVSEAQRVGCESHVTEDDIPEVRLHVLRCRTWRSESVSCVTGRPR
jgi:hypothetical protein